MENVVFTKKEMLGLGFTVAQVKGLVPVGVKKSSGRGRPARLYSQAQVDALRDGTLVAAVTVAPVAEVVEDEVSVPAVEETVSDLSDADFAAVA
jgi:hypothetical protein